MKAIPQSRQAFLVALDRDIGLLWNTALLGDPCRHLGHGVVTMTGGGAQHSHECGAPHRGQGQCWG